MKIAWLHFDLCGGPQSENTGKLLRGIEKAAKAGADWVLTPEMALQGYHMVRNKSPYVLASCENGIYDPFVQISRQQRVRLFLGCGEREEGQEPGNSLVVIDQRGVIEARHSKVKVVKWVTEEWATPGTTFSVHTFDTVKTGLLVCADAWFGEHAERLKENGAELIIVAAAWPHGDHGGPPREAWKRCSRCAGGVPVLISNQTGNRGMDCREAESAIVQKGELVCAYHGAEAVLLAELDLQQKKIITDEFMVLPFQ